MGLGLGSPEERPCMALCMALHGRGFDVPNPKT